MMNKSEILNEDILIFKNGKQTTVGINNRWVIRDFYTDDLKCVNNEEYDVIKILRPKWEVVYEVKTKTLKRGKE